MATMADHKWKCDGVEKPTLAQVATDLETLDQDLETAILAYDDDAFQMLLKLQRSIRLSRQLTNRVVEIDERLKRLT